MKAGTLLLISMLGAPAVLVRPIASQRHPPVRPTVYTSADDSFQITYPEDFKICTAGKLEPCTMQSYIPPCDEDAILCVVYPKKQLEGTTFESAAFQVREIHRPLEVMTPDVCVTPFTEADNKERPSFLISAEHPEELIGGVLFVHGETGGVAAGHQASVDLYRVFHRLNCYELGLRETGGTSADYDPPKRTPTHAMRLDLDESLSEILHSFRFLK